MSLPKNIVGLPNADKDSWKEPLSDDLMNFRRGFKMVISGRPGDGKTNLIINIVLHSREPYPFHEILICHIDQSSREYDGIDGKFVRIEDLPKPEDINSHKKILIIFEDCDFGSLKKDEKDIINTYLRYMCSHKGLSVIISCHSYTSVPVLYRSKMDVIILFRTDQTTLGNIAQKCFVDKEDLKMAFRELITEDHDSLCIDLTGSPHMIRKNLTQVIRFT